MRTFVVAASVLAAFAVTTSAAAPAPPPLLGIVLGGGQGHLGRLDPDTLRPLRMSSFLTNGYAVAPALSPDGATVALGSTSFIGVRLIDVDSLKATGEVRLRLSGAHVVASSWPSPNRLLIAAVHANPASVVFVTVDPRAAKVSRVRTVRGTPIDGSRTADGLAVLLAPGAGIGQARLVVASAARLRVWKLPIRAGRRWPVGQNSRPLGTQTIPALAIDSSNGRGYVLDPGGRVAKVDLATGKTLLHVLARRTLAKGINGPERSARWLGHGLIAFTGSNEHVQVSGGRVEVGADPAGLELVDVRHWTTRVVDRDASNVVVGGGVLFALGTTQAAPPRAYDFAGHLLFDLDGAASQDWVQVAGNRAYVGSRVLELPSGRVLGETVAGPRVIVLPTDGSQFPL
jgi:hypothetical protein